MGTEVRSDLRISLWEGELNMITRTYYLPKSPFSLQLANQIARKVGCSIGDIVPVANAIRIPFTCNDKDIKRIESILTTYGMIGEKENE